MVPSTVLTAILVVFYKRVFRLNLFAQSWAWSRFSCWIRPFPIWWVRFFVTLPGQILVPWLLHKLLSRHITTLYYLALYWRITSKLLIWIDWCHVEMVCCLVLIWLVYHERVGIEHCAVSQLIVVASSMVNLTNLLRYSLEIKVCWWFILWFSWRIPI